jgi:Putative Ig domain
MYRGPIFSGSSFQSSLVRAFVAIALCAAIAAHAGDPVKISGSPPASVVAGQIYSFTPTASDALGRRLVFTIANKPSWASFNSSSGQLSGTPSSAAVGTYSNIVISASDTWKTASLPAFAIAVTSPPLTTGSATLNWSIPTTNTDGTPVTDLAGFTVYYGSSASSLNHSVRVPSATQTSYTLDNLAAGTWYFGIAAYTTVNTQSAMSSVKSTAIQ